MFFNRISLFRSQIMGFAILWIMAFHFYKILNENFMIFPISIGYGGVDIFLLVSGFGLYYSWQKSQNIKIFLIKRFIRILPAFWFVVILESILTNSLSLSTICKLSTLGLWLPIPLSYWYISAIVVFYIIFPFYMKFYTKYREKCLYVISLIGFVLMSLYTLINYSDTHRYDICFFLSRIPVFFIGISFARLSIEGIVLKRKENILIVLSALVSLCILYYTQQLYSYIFLQNTGLSNYPFILLAPSMCLLLPSLFCKAHKLFNQGLSFLGMISLELYLVHIKILRYFPNLWTSSSKVDSIVRFIVFCVICIILAVILHYVIKIITDNIIKHIYSYKQ